MGLSECIGVSSEYTPLAKAITAGRQAAVRLGYIGAHTPVWYTLGENETMGNVNVNDKLQVAVTGNIEGAKEIANIFDYQYLGNAAITDATCLAQVQSMIGTLYGVLSVQLSNKMHLTQATVYNVTQSREVGSVSLSINGAISNDPLPAGIAGICTAYTGIKRKRGRKFIAGATEDRTTAQRFTSTMIAALSDFAAKWFADFTWDSGNKKLHPIIVSLASGIASAIIAVVVRDIPGYWRDRKPSS